MRERSGFERELSTLRVEEVERDYTDPATWVVTIGEPVVLDLDTTPFKGRIESVEWSIPGRFVGGYKGKRTKAELTELGPLELKQKRLAFFWVDAEDGRKVRATIKTKTGTERFVATFDVKGPKLEQFRTEIRANRLEKRGGLVGVRLGKLVRGSEGIEFSWAMKMPAGSGGFVKDVQTVFGDRIQTLRLAPRSSGTRRLAFRNRSNPKPHEQLDGSHDGEPGYTNELGKVERNPGESTGKIRATDSPHSSLPKLLKSLEVDQRFFYYLMFKPKKAGSIWVPVAKAEWSWKVRATPMGRDWKLEPRKQATPTLSRSTTDFPIYTSDIEENDWIEPPP
jgi:hypothetical protein